MHSDLIEVCNCTTCMRRNEDAIWVDHTQTHYIVDQYIVADLIITETDFIINMQSVLGWGTFVSSNVRVFSWPEILNFPALWKRGAAVYA